MFSLLFSLVVYVTTKLTEHVQLHYFNGEHRWIIYMYGNVVLVIQCLNVITQNNPHDRYYYF